MVTNLAGKSAIARPKKSVKEHWLVQVLGNINGCSFEITVIHSTNTHGQQSWGWINEKKLLIAELGSACPWTLVPGISDVFIELAKRYCDYLNAGNAPSPEFGKTFLAELKTLSDCPVKYKDF